jgi:DNA-3-methyladenine glycosylase
VGKIKKLGYSFYNRSSVLKIAEELLGKILVTELEGRRTAGRIVETEAYRGQVDKASHAYGGRRTKRTEIMYGEAGRAYVYLCYGIHHLFNIVTNKKNIPHAILIRALEPLEGIEIMLDRTRKTRLDFSLTRGPGNVSKALGLSARHTGENLLDDTVFLEDDGFRVQKKDIQITRRIGVDYAAEDALLLYRFSVKGNKYVSGKKN